MGELIDTPFPGERLLLEVARRNGEVEGDLQRAEQSQRCFGTRRLSNVVGDRRPERQRLDTGAGESLGERPDDSRRALISSELDVESFGDRRVRRTDVTGTGRV